MDDERAMPSTAALIWWCCGVGTFVTVAVLGSLLMQDFPVVLAIIVGFLNLPPYVLLARDGYNAYRRGRESRALVVGALAATALGILVIVPYHIAAETDIVWALSGSKNCGPPLCFIGLFWLCVVTFLQSGVIVLGRWFAG